MNQRRAQMVLAMVFAVHGTVSGNFATRVPWIKQHLGLGAGQIGLALLCVALGSFLAVPLAGKLINRFGARAVVRVGLPATTFGLAVPAFMPSFVTLCAVLLLFGVAVGAADAGMKQQAVAVERELPRPIMSGLHGLWSIGTLVGAGIGTAATFTGVDARLHLGALGLTLFAFVIGLGFGLPRTVNPVAERRTETKRRRVPSGTMILLIVIGFCSAFAEAAAHNWSSVFIAGLPGGGPGTASIGFAVFVAAMAAGRLCGDKLIARFGPVAVVRHGGLVAVAGAVLVMQAVGPGLAMLGFGLIGIGLAAIMPVVVTAASTTGSGVSTVVMSCYLAFLASPGTIGGIADSMSLATAFGLTAGILLVIVCLAGVLRPAETSSTVITRVPRMRAVRTSFTRVARSTPVMALTLGRSGRAAPVAVSIGEPVVGTAPVSLSLPSTGEWTTEDTREWATEAFTADGGLAEHSGTSRHQPIDDTPTVEIPAMRRETEALISR